MFRFLPFSVSCLLLLGCQSMPGRESAAAERFMQNLANAIHQACRTGQSTSVSMTEVESFYVLQGSTVNQSGSQQLHSLSGQELKNLGNNRMELHPGKTALVFLLVNGQEINGSMQGPPCPVALPAISYGGTDIRIEVLPSVSALVMAAYNGDLDSVRKLLDRKVDINGQSKVTPLIAAVDGDRLEVVSLLLQRGANPNVRAEFNGQVALHFAAKKGNLAVVSLLLEKGAEPNVQDPSRQTPLWSASFFNHPEVIRILVKKGADLYHKDPAGNSAMSIAAAGGAQDAIAQLVALGLKPDEPNRFGRTPLFDAVEHGQPGAVEQLLKLGANPNQKADSGKTPLQAARAKGHPDIIRMLQQAGAR